MGHDNRNLKPHIWFDFCAIVIAIAISLIAYLGISGSAYAYTIFAIAALLNIVLAVPTGMLLQHKIFDDPFSLAAWVTGYVLNLLLPIFRLLTIPCWVAWIFFRTREWDMEKLQELRQQIALLEQPVSTDLVSLVPQFLEAEIAAAEEESLGATAPLVVMQTDIEKRLAAVRALGKQLQARRRGAETERRVVLDAGIAKQKSLQYRLEAARETHERLIAAARGAFAECRTDVSKVSGAVGDAALMEELAEHEVAVDAELALAAHTVNQAAEQLFARMAGLRATLYTALNEPEHALFVAGGHTSLEDDLDRYDRFAEQVYGGVRTTI